MKRVGGKDPKTTVERWGTQGVASSLLLDLNPE